MKCFDREKYVLATMLDSYFKRKIETILLEGADADNWKDILKCRVYQNVPFNSTSLQSVSCMGPVHSEKEEKKAERVKPKSVLLTTRHE